jgi:hypothetical protein
VFDAESQLVLGGPGPLVRAGEVAGHRAQGRTVTAGITLFTGEETHEWGYPALTRGRDSNHAIVFTYSAKRADPRPGTREAPELARAHRVEQERAARDRRVWPDPDRVDKQQLEALGVLSDVLERPERELSATQWKEREAASADHLAKLHAEWQHYARAAWTARYEAELRDALPPELRDTELSGATTWLWRDLRAAEAAGLNSRDVLREAVNKRGLGDARSIAAVIFARVQNSTAGLIPLVPRPWAERVPQVDDPQLQAHLEARAAQMDARVERLGEHTAHTSPAWAVAAIGPVPDEPLKRLEWQTRIAPVAAYRELYGWDHETEPIGPEPTSDTPEKRADWHGAFAALSPAQGGVDMRAEPDDRLWLMAGTYATVTHEAPRYVGNELRFLRVTARDMHLRAVRHAFEERTARERGDQEAAARHAQREASAKAVGERVKAAEARLATSQAAYDEWEQQTTRDRWLPLAARAELQRRHPQMQLPPLRSAEPEPPSEAERRELLWPRIDQQGNVRSEPDHEAAPEPGTGVPGQSERPRARWPQVDRHGVVSDPPQWVLDAEQQAGETREKLAARASQKVPEEDHEWGDVGSAWPGLAERERDAILQPAKPQMQPARDYAGRDAQPEKEYAAAQPESGG